MPASPARPPPEGGEGGAIRMKKALFVTYGGGHVAATLPVLQALRRRGGWETSVLALTTARAVVEQAGFPSLGFLDLVRPEDREAVERGRRLAETQATPGIGVSPEESAAYLGLSYDDLERREGAERAAALFAAQGRRAFLPLGPLERLIRRLQPDVVVATSSPRAEEAAVRTAQRLGIPALCMNDLFALDRNNAYLWEPDYADRMTVLSGSVRDGLVRRGRRAADLVVTGNPAFDRLGDPGLPARAAAWRREQGLEGRTILTWASQPEPADPGLPGRVLEVLRAYAEARPERYLVHRPHPSEPPTQALPASLGRSGRGEDLAVLLRASDVVVVLTTTVGLEAAHLDRPILQVRLSAYDYTMPYEAMGIARGVDRLEAIPTALDAILGGGEAAAALAEGRRRLPPAGGAAARVVDAIDALLA